MMRGKLLELIGFVAISLLCLAGLGCSTSAVGDPCVPEKVTGGSFLASETYLELSSVQCATRVCLVPESEVERKVYCSCRCGAPAGSGVPTCGCPGGFVCEEVLETGGDGVRGSYCVRDPLLDVE